jgi:glycosyltransferase involved in cell wall biosynthesis
MGVSSARPAGAVEDTEPSAGDQPARAVRVASVARNWLIGGDERRLWETSIAMAAQDGAVEQTLFVLNTDQNLTTPERSRWARMRESYLDAGIEVVEIGSDVDMRNLRQLREVAGVVRRLAGEFRRRGIQVVDARTGLCGLVGLLAARLGGVPVTTLTTYYTDSYDGPLRYPLGQLTVALSDAIISDAQATLDDFSEWRWSTRAELVRIRNGFTAQESSLDRAEARTSLGIPEEWGTVVGQVSRILRRKGWEVFIDAAAQVAEVNPDVRFIGVGFVVDENREYMNSLLERVESLGMTERLRFCSYPGSVADVHKAIDVFTHLSTIDSQPMAIHEAMAAASPTVVSGLSGNREIVEHRRSGLVADPGSAQSAAAAILELVDDPAFARALGQEARQRFLSHHSPEMLARSHIDLYHHLLEESGHRGRRRARSRS